MLQTAVTLFHAAHGASSLPHKYGFLAEESEVCSLSPVAPHLTAHCGCLLLFNHFLAKNEDGCSVKKCQE